MWVTESWHGVGPRGRAGGVDHRYAAARWFITGEEFSAGVNMRTCIYVAGILGLAIVVTQTGIGTAVGEALLRICRWMQTDRSPASWR